MIIGICTVELSLPGNTSLKGKRAILKSLMARVRNEFNVSIAEVDNNDVWQSATLGIACIANGAGYVHGLLNNVVNWIEDSHYEIEVVNHTIELL